MSETPKPVLQEKPIKLLHADVLGVNKTPAHALVVFATALRIPVPGPDGNPVMTEFVLGARDAETLDRVAAYAGRWSPEAPPLDPTGLRKLGLVHMEDLVIDEEL